MADYDLNNYPLPGFHFRVDFLFEDNQSTDNFVSGPQESAFQEVSGIKASMDIEEYAELGFVGQPRAMITGRKFENLVLKRGLSYSNKLASWFETSLYRKESTHIPVLVSVLNTEGAELGKPVMSWLFFQAYPVSFEVSGFDASKSEYLYETIELRYSYFIQLDTKGTTNLSDANALFGKRRTTEIE